MPSRGRRYAAAREPGESEDYFVHDGGPGNHAFVVEDARIVPIDPATGERAAPSITVPDIHLLDAVLSISELPAAQRVVVTWYDTAQLAA